MTGRYGIIRMHVSLVLSVYDGFTGRAMPNSSVSVLLDGQRFRPEYRSGGYLVFYGLEPGEHELVLNALNFREERFSVAVTETGREERIVSLKPSERYSFGRDVTILCLEIARESVPLSGSRVWLAPADTAELKIAQDSASEGDVSARLYTRGKETLPGEYLIADGENSEICVILELSDGVGFFAAPLTRSHKRGTVLRPCRSYETDLNGLITAYFPRAVPIDIFVDGKLESAVLSEGENQIALKL